METQIKNIFSKNLVTLKDSDTLHQAEDLMNNHNIRHLPVTDANDTLVGMLSKSDFIALKHVDSRLREFTVKSLMSSPVKIVAANSKVKAVAQLFISKKINSALIVENKEVVGIVTSEDLIRLLAEREDLSSEAEKMDLAELASEGWISMTTLI
ncbi:MAG: CBS domain-containing protein [Bdellovibrionota bacterium]